MEMQSNKPGAESNAKPTWSKQEPRIINRPRFVNACSWNSLGPIKTKAFQSKHVGLCTLTGGLLRPPNGYDVMVDRSPCNELGSEGNSCGARVQGNEHRNESALVVAAVVDGDHGLPKAFSGRDAKSQSMADNLVCNDGSVDKTRGHPNVESKVTQGESGLAPTWVVKPAAKFNCGFGIQVCCSLQVNSYSPSLKTGFP